MATKKGAGRGPRRPGPSVLPATDAGTEALHGFFRELYAKPALMDRFNAGATERQRVLDESKLSEAHKKLIRRGCIPDVIHALVGAPAFAAAYTTLIDCTDSLMCDHPHCHAFTQAARGQTAAPQRPAAKRGAAAPRKKAR